MFFLKKRGYIIYIYILLILPLATCITRTTYVCFYVVYSSFCATDQQDNRPDYISVNIVQTDDEWQTLGSLKAQI